MFVEQGSDGYGDIKKTTALKRLSFWSGQPLAVLLSNISRNIRLLDKVLFQLGVIRSENVDNSREAINYFRHEVSKHNNKLKIAYEELLNLVKDSNIGIEWNTRLVRVKKLSSPLQREYIKQAIWIDKWIRRFPYIVKWQSRLRLIAEEPSQPVKTALLVFAKYLHKQNNLTEKAGDAKVEPATGTRNKDMADSKDEFYSPIRPEIEIILVEDLKREPLEEAQAMHMKKMTIVNAALNGDWLKGILKDNEEYITRIQNYTKAELENEREELKKTFPYTLD